MTKGSKVDRQREHQANERTFLAWLRTSLAFSGSHEPEIRCRDSLRKGSDALHTIKQIDLLVIDTVGFDFEILKMFPFDTIKPSIIHFEHSLLSSEDQISCFRLLTILGYGLTQVSVDTIAYLNAPIRQGRYVVSSQ